MDLNREYICAKGAGYRYPNGDFELEPTDISLRLGEIVFLTGGNGSGKTTLSKVLCGILKPVKGDVFLDGKNTKDLTLGQIGAKVGYLLQDPQMQLFAPRVMEDLTFADRLNGMTEREAEDKAAYWLELFGLTGVGDSMIHTLSGGEKQRLALAAIMMRGADYLILDEPSKSLDDQNRDRLYALLSDLRVKRNIGMLIISHDKRLTSALADRTLEMSGGAVVNDFCRKI